MKKLLVLAALMAGIAGAANAASIDILLTQNGPGSSDWTLSVNNNSSTPIGAVNFEVVGLTSMVVNTQNAAISPDDSGLTPDAIGPGQAFGAVNNLPNQTIVAPGVVNAVLATLSGGTSALLRPAELNAQSATLYTPNGAAITDTSLFSVSTHPAVPEPATLLLLGLGLGALAFVRRSAA
ncbi:MAG TPA: PEP-CTERM sorting domain-containing protein [Gemmatimonadales bacterium]|nr:PEP-CTERM sorting domain-containing protein [Gemmatimonadales bacterium]